jgi:hypothetical protein|tara:strand:+ start:168 stop:752 length:585 start_codon:yes stop_codon:yes gene_type:complete
MANLDAPFGLRPVGELGSDIQNGGTSKYLIASGESDVIMKGDLVKLEATGYITLSTDSDAVAAIGVFNGCFYIAPTTKKPTWSNYYAGSITPASGSIEAFVYDDPNKLYEIQSDGTIAQSSVGRNTNIVYTVGSTVNGQSKTELDATTESAGVTGQLRIIRISEDPDNSDISADNANWIVRINEHQYYNNGLGV